MNQKLVLLLLMFGVFFNGCVRSYMVKTNSTKAQIEQVNVMAVEYFRPDYDPAEHDDFKNKARELKCETPQELWVDILKSQKAVLDCVNSIKEDTKAVYFYVPATQPYLQIDAEEEKNPKCLIKDLAKIPLPREIYYLGKKKSDDLDEEPQECYSSSFSTKTNEFMKTTNTYLKKKIVIQFPLDRKLNNSRDLSMWLMVNTFSILKSDEQAEGHLIATSVPESVCRVCFKNDALFDDKFTRKLKPVFWP